MSNQATLALARPKSSLIIIIFGGHGTVAEAYYDISGKRTIKRIEGKVPLFLLSHLPPCAFFMRILSRYLIKRHGRQKRRLGTSQALSLTL